MDDNKNSNYEPRRHKWDALELFKNITPQTILLSEKDKMGLKDFLWSDLCAEYDSVNLYKEFLASKYRYSQEFLSFIDVWHKDESNHANGFCKIYHLLYGDEEKDIWARLEDRQPDFSGLESFFQDEFKLCVLFAYDEYASSQTYQKDKFYDTFGAPVFNEWIRNLVKDEAMHFGNLIRLIHHKHHNRTMETKDILVDIVKMESNFEYKATFLLDHDGPHFLLSLDELTTACVDKVLQKITRNNTATIKSC